MSETASSPQATAREYARTIMEQVSHISRGCRSERRHNPTAYEVAIEDAVAALVAKVERLAAAFLAHDDALRLATNTARHLHAMIDRETWRAQGAEWQGQYEGDYWAEQTLAQINEWAALAEGVPVDQPAPPPGEPGAADAAASGGEPDA